MIVGIRQYEHSNYASLSTSISSLADIMHLLLLFFLCLQTFMGQSLVLINPQTHRLPHKALTCSRGLSDDLRLLMRNTLLDVEERKQSHAIVVRFVLSKTVTMTCVIVFMA